MDFSYSDEQQSLLDLAKQILGDRSTPERLKTIERAGGPRFDRELWAELAKAGLLGVGVPEADGGQGFGFLEIAGVAEEVGRCAAAVPFVETMVLGVLPLVAYGSAAQRQAMLAPVTTGEQVLTAALSEPEGDPLRPATRADANGQGWRLHGTKLCVPYAEVADRILVPASTPDGLIALFWVDPSVDGVAATALQTTAGLPETLLELDGVAVAADATLGPVGDGRTILAALREQYDAALAAVALGACSEALRLTAQYTSERKQFGQPIASFQAAGHRAADAYIDNEAIRLTVRQAAWRIAVGLPAAEQVAVAKYWAAEAGHRVVHAAQHLHGGVGVDRDYALHRYFLYVRQIELTGGSGPDQLRRLGKMIADAAPV